jgi:hypothetical protein
MEKLFLSFVDVAVRRVGCTTRTKELSFAINKVGDNICGGAHSAPYDTRGF